MELEKIISQVRAPIQYLNKEINSVRKDPNSARLRVVLAFPDLYEIGISHYGHKLLYYILNSQTWIFCDRAYAPASDLKGQMEKANLPLFAWESRIPLKDFDLLGFTLASELSYTNVLYMLALAKIPLRAEERKKGNFPLIIAGGPCVSNPEPVWKFFDAFFFGEADEAILEIAELVREWKENGDGDKLSLLKELCQIPGVYVPEFYQPEFDSAGRLKKIQAKDWAPEKISRRILPDLNQAFSPTAQLVPISQAVHDRLVVEIARGCTRGCRFCSAGIIYRPYRERSLEKILELTREGLAQTGYEECSFLSLSAGDYSRIEELIVKAITEHWEKRIAISLPSLRANSLTPVLLSAIQKVRKTGFTIAPEAGSERLRKVINKFIPDQEILETCEKILKAGWRSLKLYFMVGLPTETEQDHKAIIQLCQKINSLAKKYQPACQINLSISGFIPKPHTPFQWEAQLGIKELEDIRARLKKELARSRFRFRFEDPKNTFLEGVLSRAGRELAEVIESAFKKGACFDNWSDQLKFDLWLEAFEEKGIDPQAYLKERDETELLPWEHLESVKKEFLLKERKNSRSQKLTPDCRLEGCWENCGVCDHKNIFPRKEKPAEEPKSSTEQIDQLPAQPELYFRYLVRYRREGEMRFLGLLENNRLFTRAVRRAGLPMRYSRGFHPMPRIVFGIAPPVGVESEAEYLELELIEHLSPQEIKQKLNQTLPEGLEIVEVREISPKAPAITQQISSIDYLAIIPDQLKPRISQEKLNQFISAEQFLIEQKREKGNRELDLKQKIKFIQITPEKDLKFSILVSEGPGVKPQEVLENIFGFEAEELAQILIRRTQAHLRQQRPVSYPTSPVRARKVERFRRR